MIEPLAKRIAPIGWHIQLNMEGEQVVELADLLRRLPTQLVFDHLGNPLAEGINHPSHAIILGLLKKGRTWVKLSGAYSNSKIGPPDYPEATKIAQAFVKAAPSLWGSDWPHPGVPNNKPDDALLLDLLTVWVPNEAMRNRVLVAIRKRCTVFRNRPDDRRCASRTDHGSRSYPYARQSSLRQRARAHVAFQHEAQAVAQMRLHLLRPWRLRCCLPRGRLANLG